MRIDPIKRFPCVICGKESAQHTNWFLAIDNSWSDRLKILSWHPVLAEQADVFSTCGNLHLEVLITHLLTYANLQCHAIGTTALALAEHEDAPAGGPDSPSAGRLVGELAVHRESLSPLWTGSPEARESIFEALVGGLRARQTAFPQTPADGTATVQMESVTLPNVAVEYLQQLALQ